MSPTHGDVLADNPRRQHISGGDLGGHGNVLSYRLLSVGIIASGEHAGSLPEIALGINRRER